MPISEAEFAHEVERAIRRYTSETSSAPADAHFVSTLCNYVIGIVKLEPLDRDGGKMRAMLKEFLESSTDVFVDWWGSYQHQGQHLHAMRTLSGRIQRYFRLWGRISLRGHAGFLHSSRPEDCHLGLRNGTQVAQGARA
jgi:hypothetical protein